MGEAGGKQASRKRIAIRRDQGSCCAGLLFAVGMIKKPEIGCI